MHMYIHTHIPDLKAVATLSFKVLDSINWGKQLLSHVSSAVTSCKIW